MNFNDITLEDYVLIKEMAIELKESEDFTSSLKSLKNLCKYM